MKIKFTDGNKAEAFVNDLIDKQTHVIEVEELPNGNGYEVQYIEHKTYTSLDGKSYPDEVWVTKEGDMKLIQDLEPEHARNILRMLLRQEREAKAGIEAMFEQIQSALKNGSTEEDDEFDSDTTTPHTLH